MAWSAISVLFVIVDGANHALIWIALYSFAQLAEESLASASRILRATSAAEPSLMAPNDYRAAPNVRARHTLVSPCLGVPCTLHTGRRITGA